VGGFLNLAHVTLAGNTGGYGAYSTNPTSAWIDNSIAWGNSAGGFLIWSPTSSCNIDQSGSIGIVADPQFVSTSNEDYRLQAGSPAIDACSSGLTIDLEGVPRPLGDGYDMGAYEYVGPVYLPLVLRAY